MILGLILFLVHLNKTGIVADVHPVDQLAARKWDGIQQNLEATLSTMEIPDLVPLTVEIYNKAKVFFIFSHESCDISSTSARS